MKHEQNSATGPLTRQAAWLEHYQPGLRITEQGSVVSVGDGIAWMSGLPSAAMEDILDFEDGSRAMVFDLTEEMVGAVMLHETEALTAGTAVHLTHRALSIPVGDSLLGRVIDPLGIPLDSGAEPEPIRERRRTRTRTRVRRIGSGAGGRRPEPGRMRRPEPEPGAHSPL